MPGTVRLLPTPDETAPLVHVVGSSAETLRAESELAPEPPYLFLSGMFILPVRFY